MHTLNQLGWTDGLSREFASLFPELTPARVTVVERAGWRISGDGWHAVASCAGRLVRDADRTQLPAVGDWVALTHAGAGARIVGVMPRSSALIRKAAGSGEGQSIAANLDTVFIVSAVGGDFNPRRIERYVATVLAGDAQPVVVVNKCDLPYDPLEMIIALEQAAPGVPVAFVSALRDVAELEAHLRPGTTIGLVGSSGVGKSTLVNRILGEERQDTGGVREGDHKGRHTTTRRELLVAPSGAIVVDTPGMRELGLFDAQAGVGMAFADVEELAEHCRFADCTHTSEPECALLASVEAGDLAPSRLASYLKLEREAAYERRRTDARAARAEQKKWKANSRAARVRNKVAGRMGLKTWD